MSAANRRRGADAERAVVNYLRQWWPDTRRYLAGDGRQPGDLDWHPLICCEVKDVARSAIPTWCRQAVAEAPEGTVPVVVRRTRGAPDVGEWMCWYPERAVRAGGVLVGPITARYWGRVNEAWWMSEPFDVFVERVRQIDEAS